MRRLTLHLSQRVAAEALALFAIVSVLLWLVQCLRVFDVVSVKGQDLGTLGTLAALNMPPLVLTLAFVCVGIGLARALGALAEQNALVVVHAGAGPGPLVAATALVASVGTVLVLILSNFVAPQAERGANALNASVTADLVGSTLQPGRFIEAVPGVVLLIGGRAGNGEITEFFADDRRDPEARRTYLADAATVYRLDDGYVLALREGALQTREPDGRFSEVRFARYEVNVERFAQASAWLDPVAGADTVALLSRAFETGAMEPRARRAIASRIADALKVAGISLVVLGLYGFPSGRRSRRALPREVVVLVIAFGELGISSYDLLGSELGPLGGALVMIAGGGALLLARARPRVPGRAVPMEEALAEALVADRAGAR